MMTEDTCDRSNACLALVNSMLLALTSQQDCRWRWLTGQSNWRHKVIQHRKIFVWLWYQVSSPRCGIVCYQSGQSGQAACRQHFETFQTSVNMKEGRIRPCLCLAIGNHTCTVQIGRSIKICQCRSWWGALLSRMSTCRNASQAA